MASHHNPDHTDLDRMHSAVRREKADLPAGNEGAPMWAIFLGFVAAILAGGQMGTTSGGYSLENVAHYGPSLDPRISADGLGGPQLDEFQLAMKKGSSTYAVCTGCHTPTGVGVPGQYPPLAGSEFVLGGTERLTRIVLHGLTGPVSVKGLNYNFPGGMPLQGASIPDADLANVLTFIRNSWGNEAPMVTKEMVASVRSAEKGRASQWTATELEKHATKNIPGVIPAGPGATAPAATPDAKK
jgi:mono/diheme cytochrome c family protein